MTKKHDILLVALFFVFLGAMALGIAFLPKQDISENEKRTLARFPSLSIERVLNGKWESDFEEYISDHFPSRDFFASLDAYCMLYSGRNGSNGIYKGKEGYLITTPVKRDSDNIRDNLTAVSEFAKKTGLKTTLMVVPETGYIMSEKLPENHMEYTAFDEETEGVGILDIASAMLSKKNETQLFYKTDHHWTSEGAYTAYGVWAEANSVEVREKKDYTIETADNFYGTAYSKSALWNEKPDTIEVWKYPIDVTVKVGDAKYDSMFFDEHLERMDKYPVFLNGNNSLVEITNNSNPSGKRVLVIKDSYAHCFVPFITENCSQIDMVDLRYYLDQVSRLTDKNDYDEVLVLYGMSNLCEANDLSILE